MRYDSETAFREILRRGEALRKRKERRTIQALSAASAALLILMILSVQVLPPEGSAEGMRSVYGAFLLPAEAGGYVLAAVVAFAVGAVVTVACIRYRDKKNQDAFRGDSPGTAIPDDLIGTVSGGEADGQKPEESKRRNGQ